jgi:hypothetical protein
VAAMSLAAPAGEPRPRPARRRLAAALAVVAVALAVAGPWYARIAVRTGNPLFPFYGALFGHNEWEPEWAEPPEPQAPPAEAGPSGRIENAVRSAAHGAAFLLAVPWHGIVDRATFHFEAPLAPWWLLLAPLGALAALTRAEARRWLLVTLAFGGLWLATPRALHYWMGLLPVFGLAVVAALDGWVGARRWGVVNRLLAKRGAVVAVAVALAAPGPLYGVYKLAQRGPVPVGATACDAYLARYLPGYPAVVRLNRERGDETTLYALFGARLRYYAAGRFRGQWTGPWSYQRLLRHRGDLAAICHELREMNVDVYLEVDDPTAPPAVPKSLSGDCLQPLESEADYRLFTVRGARR